jgi:hypothetical protein
MSSVAPSAGTYLLNPYLYTHTLFIKLLNPLFVWYNYLLNPLPIYETHLLNPYPYPYTHIPIYSA